METNTIYNLDVLAGLKLIQDNSISVINFTAL